jgi:hypothetical protein
MCGRNCRTWFAFYNHGVSSKSSKLSRIGGLSVYSSGFSYLLVGPWSMLHIFRLFCIGLAQGGWLGTYPFLTINFLDQHALIHSQTHALLLHHVPARRCCWMRNQSSIATHILSTPSLTQVPAGITSILSPHTRLQADVLKVWLRERFAASCYGGGHPLHILRDFHVSWTCSSERYCVTS